MGIKIEVVEGDMGEEGEGTGREESHCTSLLDILTTQLTQIYVYNYMMYTSCT